jgi:lipopolysaccharide export LptBFGC system permease protein LptF
MTFSQMREALAKHNLSKAEARILLIDFNGRVAIPLATFILTILAVPLGIKIKRGDKSISLGVSLVAVVGYYVFYLAGTFLARTGIVSPLVGMWVPNFLILASGVWLHVRMIRQ